MDDLQAYEESTAYALIDRIPDLARRAAETYPLETPLGKGALHFAARDALLFDGLTAEAKNGVALALLAEEIGRIRAKNGPASFVPGVQAPTEHPSKRIRKQVLRLLAPIFVGTHALDEYRRFLARSLRLTLDAPELAYAVRDLGLRVESLLACIIAIKQARDFSYRRTYYASRVKRALFEKNFEDDEDTVKKLMTLDTRGLARTEVVSMASPSQPPSKTVRKNGGNVRQKGRTMTK